MKKFLIENISKKPKNKDLLFLGNPRLKPEAQLLKKIMDAKKEKFLVLYITIPEKEIYLRSFKRNGDKKVHDDYKILDTQKTIAKRIKWHKLQVEDKTIKYFHNMGLLQEINGDQPISKVAKDVEEALRKHKRLLET
jgi:adenylate kinase family enzyme